MRHKNLQVLALAGALAVGSLTGCAQKTVDTVETVETVVAGTTQIESESTENIVLNTEEVETVEETTNAVETESVIQVEDTTAPTEVAEEVKSDSKSELNITNKDTFENSEVLTDAYTKLSENTSYVKMYQYNSSDKSTELTGYLNLKEDSFKKVVVGTRMIIAESSTEEAGVIQKVYENNETEGTTVNVSDEYKNAIDFLFNAPDITFELTGIANKEDRSIIVDCNYKGSDNFNGTIQFQIDAEGLIRTTNEHKNGSTVNVIREFVYENDDTYAEVESEFNEAVADINNNELLALTGNKNTDWQSALNNALGITDEYVTQNSTISFTNADEYESSKIIVDAYNKTNDASGIVEVTHIDKDTKEESDIIHRILYTNDGYSQVSEGISFITSTKKDNRWNRNTMNNGGKSAIKSVIETPIETGFGFILMPDASEFEITSADEVNGVYGIRMTKKTDNTMMAGVFVVEDGRIKEMFTMRDGGTFTTHYTITYNDEVEYVTKQDNLLKAAFEIDNPDVEVYKQAYNNR